MMADLDTELREMLTWHDGLSEDDPRKHEITAFVYMTCARAAWRKVDMLRAAERRAEHRRSRREQRD
jgi:cell wall assembly regulator SMI1